MPTKKSPLQTCFDSVIKSAVTDVLKPRGFSKSALNFHRRCGENVQVINIQSSSGSSWGEKVFYVNVGLAFDSICKLSKVEILEKPKEHECDCRGTRGRLEKFLDDLPPRWLLRCEDNWSSVAEQLKLGIEKLASDLERLDGPAAYRSHHWFDRFQPNQVNAQVLYLLDDLDAAWLEVNQICTLFADRKGLNQPSWWVKELRLSKLADRLN